MKLTKLFGLAAIVLSANMANAGTYQVNINDYGGITTTYIDGSTYPKINGCIIYCNDGYILNGVLYRSRTEVQAIAYNWFNGLRPDIKVSEFANPVAPNSPSIYDKVNTAYSNLLETHASVISLKRKVSDTAAQNAVTRLNQHKDIVGWYVDGVYEENTTFEEAVKTYSTARISEINDFHYQTNSNGDMRLRLKNEDNSYFGDWIYASNVSELIVGLTEETFSEGFQQGYEFGYENGYYDGYVEGYADGFRDGLAQ